MDLSFLPYHDLFNVRIFRRWLIDPDSIYTDKVLYSQFILLKKTRRFGPFVEEIITNGLSFEEISEFANHGIFVADCFRRDEK